MKYWLRAAVMVVLAVLLVGVAHPAMAAITPPTQPASGPGGADYKWGTPTFVFHDVWWNDDLDYWTLEPANWSGPGARPANAPIVVFNHGWNGNDPALYWASLVHLARKGNIVIFPKYQNWWTNAQYFTSNAIWSVKDAIGWLQWWATVKPNTALGMQLIGHSAGGAVSANMANQWQSQGLPQPRAIVGVEPWDGAGGQYLDASLAGIPNTTVIDCIVTDEDNVVGRTGLRCDLGSLEPHPRNQAQLRLDVLRPLRRPGPGGQSLHRQRRGPRLLRRVEAGRRVARLRDVRDQLRLRAGQHHPAAVHGAVERRARGAAASSDDDQAAVPGREPRAGLRLRCSRRTLM